MHQGVVQDRSGTGRGTTWTVKWEGYPKSAVHVGKDLSMVRLDPRDPSSRPTRKAPEADRALLLGAAMLLELGYWYNPDLL